MEVLISPLSSMILLGIGIALIGLEILLATFFIFCFGVAFILVAGWHFVFPFNEGAYQLVAVSVLAMIFVFLFKNKLKMLFMKSEKNIKEDFLNEKGIGEVVEGMINYKGTLWEYEPIDLELKNKQKVKVIEAKNNKVRIELL